MLHTHLSGNMIFHIAHINDVAAIGTLGYYTTASLASEGFIHASTAEQLHTTGRRYFAQKPDLYVIAIDEAKLQVPVRYEQSTNGEHYPHIYGTVNLEAIVQMEATIF